MPVFMKSEKNIGFILRFYLIINFFKSIFLCMNFINGTLEFAAK